MMLDKIVSFWGIGSGSLATYPRRVQFITATEGWDSFVAKYLQPQRDLGITRFLLWMPFGQEDELRGQRVNGQLFPTRVRFDQWQQSLDSGHAYIWQGFSEAIRPLTEDGCQVIAYCGTLGGSPEYERERWYRRQWIDECLSPFKDANCDIAIDTACRSPVDHYVWQIARVLRVTTAVKVYCESMPLASAPLWANSDVISVEEQYQNALNPANRSVLVDPARIKGELIRMFTTPNTPINKEYFDTATNQMRWADWYRAKVPAALADKHTVCLHVRNFLEQGGNLEDLVT